MRLDDYEFGAFAVYELALAVNDVLSERFVLILTIGIQCATVIEVANR
jgi:hypothetical protein